LDGIVVLTLLVMLALAAPRWGRTSSCELRSKEHDLASYGISWRDLR